MISMTSEYALRAMVSLAAQPDGRALLGRELAESASIPANYLAKILLTLRNAGLVVTVRGTGGGYLLSKPATEVKLGEILDLFEVRRLVAGRCLLDREKECAHADACTAHDAWHQVGDVYRLFLDQTTLAEISSEPSQHGVTPAKAPQP
jgi:Rrf2 family protein